MEYPVYAKYLNNRFTECCIYIYRDKVAVETTSVGGAPLTPPKYDMSHYMIDTLTWRPEIACGSKNHRKVPGTHGVFHETESNHIHYIIL
jgi:hypothetical protein